MKRNATGFSSGQAVFGVLCTGKEEVVRGLFRPVRTGAAVIIAEAHSIEE